MWPLPYKMRKDGNECDMRGWERERERGTKVEKQGMMMEDCGWIY